VHATAAPDDYETGSGDLEELLAVLEPSANTLETAEIRKMKAKWCVPHLHLFFLFFWGGGGR
jgi:hypothetical protein